MGKLLKAAIWWKGGQIKRSFDRATMNPQTAQASLLHHLLKAHQSSQYGQQHQFARISTPTAYADTVPIQTFSDVSPYIERMKRGERNVLTADQPVLFNMTSGTTSDPKYVPITHKDIALTARRSHQWLYRALHDHPKMLDHAFVCISGASIEGYTESDIPFGSASGMMYESLPRALRSSFAIPFFLSHIKDYDLRYYMIARLALARDVSFVVTPNPTTLIKLAETGIRYQAEITRSIRDGVPGNAFEVTPDDQAILHRIAGLLRPDPQRAQDLETVVEKHGTLYPHACWKQLKLIGCWLGGSIGYQAEKLDRYYANVAKRDLGYVASEGCMTIPYQDNQPAGILALHNNFYEFIPYEESDTKAQHTLLCHELEAGRQYRIILTNHSGLYRYDIDDIIEVRDFYNRTPVIAFVQKGADILNITGEKLHVNHAMEAFRFLAATVGVSVAHYRFIPNRAEMRYDILLKPESENPRDFWQHDVIPLIDRVLSTANIEYAAKRKSGRLAPPCLHIMEDSWVADVRQHAGPSQRGDVQFKWRIMAANMSDIDAQHILYTIGR